ncbi:MAG: VWA domain-containing protein [Gammaproteobacteria bacterium]
MKRRRKGLEIFSMSALDLFAAAMGAFVLIAVIALPYYKKEIPDLLSKISVLSEELTQKDAQIAAQTAEIEQQKEEIAQQTAEIAAQELQIAQQSTRIEELDAGVKTAEAMAKKLQEEVADLLGNVSALSEELTQKNVQIAGQMAEIEQQKEEIAQQTAKITAKEWQIAQQSTRIEELDAGMKTAEARARKLQREVADLEKRPKYQLPNLDVVIVLDTTGSMGDVIASLKQELRNLASVLGQIAPSAAIGIIGFNDRRQTLAEYVIFPLQKVAVGDGSLRAITRALQPIEARSSSFNIDWAENLYGGLRLAVKQPWRSNSEAQVIVVVTDALPHEGTKRAVLAVARDFAADKKKTITAVNVGDKNKEHYYDRNNQYYDYGELKHFMGELARVGQGKYVETRSSLVAPILLGILAGT